MKKTIMSFALLLSGFSVFASTVIVGLPDENGNRLYEIEGCYAMESFVAAGGYTGVLALTEAQWAENARFEDVIVCLNDQYTGKNDWDLFQKIAEDALRANCFKTTIDEADKTVVFEFLSKNRRVVRDIDGATITLEGYEPLLKEGIKIVDNLCILDLSVAHEHYRQIKHLLTSL